MNIKLIKKLLKVFSFKTGAIAGSFTLQFLITQELDVAQAGQYFWAFSLLYLISNLSKLGLDEVTVREVSANFGLGNLKAARGTYCYCLKSALTVGLVISIFVGGASIYKGFDSSFILIVMFCSPVLATSGIVAACYQARHKQVVTIIINGWIVQFSLCIFLVVFNVSDAESIFRVHFLVLILLVLISFAFNKSFNSYASLETEKTNLLKSGLSILFTKSVGIFHSWGVPVLLGLFVSSGEVALYFIASRLSSFANVFFVSVVNSIISPKLALQFEMGDINSAAKLARLSVLFLIFTALPTVVFLIFFGKYLLNLFGSEYVAAATALTILCLGQIGNIVLAPNISILIMSNMERVVVRSQFVGLIGNCLLLIILVPYFGINGAAISTASTIVFTNIFLWVKVRQIYSISVIPKWPFSSK